MLKKNALIMISLIGLLIILHQLTEKNPDQIEKTTTTANLTQIKKPEQLNQAATKDNEPALKLQASAACVFDIYRNKWIFDLNKETQLPLASLTKLMTAVVAQENLLSDTLLEISKEAIMQEGDSGFEIGEIYHFSELIEIMLISSSNDAAFAIAGALRTEPEPNTNSYFVKLMNSKAKELELSQALFFNATGLDITDDLAGAYGSCQDLVKLMRYLIIKYPKLLEVTKKEDVIYNNRIFNNTNELLPKLPFFIGGKTGFSDLAGGNLIIALDNGPNRPVIIVVLGSTEQGRFKDAEMLYNRYYNGLKRS